MNIEGMGTYLNFVRAYTDALHRVVTCAYLEQTYLAKPSLAVKLGEFKEGPLRERQVVVVPKPIADIYFGQAVLGVRNGRVEQWGKIEDIQLNNSPVQRVSSDSAASEIGLQVDFKISGSMKLYLLPVPDEAVWSTS